MPTWKLTATSLTGDKVDPITGSSTDSITVYDRADLDRRIAAAEKDPRGLVVVVEQIS